MQIQLFSSPLQDDEFICIHCHRSLQYRQYHIMNPLQPKANTYKELSSSSSTITTLSNSSSETSIVDDEQYDDAESQRRPSLVTVDSFHDNALEHTTSTNERVQQYTSYRRSSKEEKYMSDDKFVEYDTSPSSSNRQLIQRVFTTNLVPNEMLLRVYRNVCHPYRHLHHQQLNDQDSADDADDGGLIMIKLVKLWVCTIVSIIVYHEFARFMVS
ncbi:predicted protein [Thalassiosira pseudonana CCMP1335]|uniref:Uncharacterized protein n=1 Tax=Thalassiosira pseudonana TaxID=35128 RepID=B8CDK6_THAPS|nr:predicted protein [Thalassiosira pseudonana CCMP1335]EED88469.1 predicted protein [Thalassiosira pseudonana CCMP1335]